MLGWNTELNNRAKVDHMTSFVQIPAAKFHCQFKASVLKAVDPKMFTVLYLQIPRFFNRGFKV